MYSGVLLVDKPAGPTSHAIVSAARKALGLKKIGHAGTLDPMATGLLVLGVGPGTKLLTYCIGLDKTYTATIRLGVATTTDDAQGEPHSADIPADALNRLTAEAIERALAQFVGPIQQVPSSVSAIKVDGKRAYDRVRAGDEVVLAPRAVTITRITVGSMSRDGALWDVDCEVDCSSGTYIRALARDLGATLNVGGHLTALRRTRVGPFHVDNAVSAEDISPSAVMALSDVASQLMPTISISRAQTVELGHGKQVYLDAPGDAGPDQPVACLSPEGQLVAICAVSDSRARILVGFPAGV